ncbi:hypothetical protein [Flavobacterium davisii]|uniref:Carboxypeptidase-like regulatory domain-containing protein n=1 Tax=Flavobacterium columnare TaxID=996 RepID=A0A8G0KT89_9FLAO|nr:hypothetical protein [Flavobacterium davisii]QYS87969.1 hypothetical protein JJC05_08685 [Flavobacterium davisii]
MKAIFLYSTLFLNTFAWTQNTFQIKGGIKDINKRAISGLVTFTVKDFSETIATDSLGNFNFKITGDKLYLKVEAEGYTNYESDFKITKDIYINIILKQNPKINEIIINEDRRKTLFKNEKSILKLNIPQLNELPSLTGTLDVSKMLQLTPVFKIQVMLMAIYTLEEAMQDTLFLNIMMYRFMVLLIFLEYFPIIIRFI